MTVSPRTSGPFVEVAGRIAAVGPVRYDVLGCLLYLAFFATGISYVAVRVCYTIPVHPISAALSGLLLLGEVLLLARTAVYGLFITRAKREYTSQEVLLCTNYYHFHVRVLVPCYNEGLQLVQQTVLAAAQARLPQGCRKSIYLCDDGKDPAKQAWIKSIAGSLPGTPGFSVDSLHYVSDRPRHPNDGNGKSNNLNHALKTVVYPGMTADDIPLNEVIAVLDADMVALPHIFTTLLPYLAEETDAIVQSPQNWYNYDPSSDVLDHSAKLKWHTTIPQLVNGWSGIVCMGSNFVLRSRALARVGWWPTWTVSEGIGLAQELKTAGYKGYFVEEILAIGEVPTGVKDKYVQYSRLIKGYLTNWLSLKHGSLWDCSKTLVEKISANGVNRDLLCGFYAPLLLGLPPIALLAGVPILNLTAPPVLALWLSTWLTLAVLNQAVLQWRSLDRAAAGPFANARAACDVGANWLSNLFGSVLYWDVILAAIPAVLKAELSGTPLGFAVTPKSIKTTTLALARTLSTALSRGVASAVCLGRSFTAHSTSAPSAFSDDSVFDVQRIFSAARLEFTAQQAAAAAAPAASESAIASATATITLCSSASHGAAKGVELADPKLQNLTEQSSPSMVDTTTASDVTAPVPAWPSTTTATAAATATATAAAAHSVALPEVVNPLTKTYQDRAGPEGCFPWAQLKLHVLMLALSLAGAVKGIVSLGLSGLGLSGLGLSGLGLPGLGLSGLGLFSGSFSAWPICASLAARSLALSGPISFSVVHSEVQTPSLSGLQPETLVLTAWCLYNALPLVLLMVRTVKGDSLWLAGACKVAPRVVLGAGAAVLGMLLHAVLV